jgi:hypothetical protein
MWSKKALIGALALLLAGCCSYEGVVIDGDTGRPVPDAHVDVVEYLEVEQDGDGARTVGEARTDAEGRFVVHVNSVLACRAHVLRVRARGYLDRLDFTEIELWREVERPGPAAGAPRSSGWERISVSRAREVGLLPR